ncbi:MAG TPA: Sir2 family NAD-dependent protein deacetylase, partial [Pirellulales bacterium]
MELPHAIEGAASAIRAADSLVITAGAGMGVDSGLPDFRGNEGFWKAYPPIAKLKRSFSEMANPRWFDADPTLAWGFYGHRLNLYRETTPHAGFAMLKAWKPEHFVFTSNVDGHFQQAGFDDDRICECHGSLAAQQCLWHCGQPLWSTADLRLEIDMETLRVTSPLPKCPQCGGPTRPNVLMFGDAGWDEARTQAQHARMVDWLRARGKRARLAIVEMGAGSAVPTVREFSESLA